MKTTKIIWDYNSNTPGWYARYNDPGNDSINHHDNYLDCDDHEMDSAYLVEIATNEAPKEMTKGVRWENLELLGEVSIER